ncbi:hypothetical protein CERSUDRAFT_119374 [Gelatoporia subvermispora B]|uniref:Uncharacterized protein n=1 Tax=Ceriporiopsis subvermispora (strain B) TaxID=914234 RepID=M2P8S3_CERS8|nr:hypothetical protein CERSUDRAFT_119374 [Gelatoporia subvermispora B]
MSDGLFQNSYYICINVNDILYGVELVLYYQTMRQLLKPSRDQRTRSDKFFMFFSTAMLLLITINVATEAVFGEEMWIVNANFPGGANAYLGANASVWYQTMGTTSFVALNLLADGLMLYRCFVIWNDKRIVIVPFIVWLATWALGIIELYASGAPGADFFVGKAAQLGLAYYSTSIGLNVLLTGLICFRIVRYAHYVQPALGSKVARTYTGAASIIIESALPYTLAGIAYLVSYGMNSGISILMGAFYSMFACISQQVLILRVVSGRAWTKETAIESEMVFSDPPISARRANFTDHSTYATEDTFNTLSKSELFASTSIKMEV